MVFHFVDQYDFCFMKNYKMYRVSCSIFRHYFTEQFYKGGDLRAVIISEWPDRFVPECIVYSYYLI